MIKKRTHSTWRRDEVELLIQHLDEKPNELVKLFPTRGYYSILSKRSKLVNAGQKKPDVNQPMLDFEHIYSNTGEIDDINEILNQSLIKVEELAIENSKLQSRIKELEDELYNVNTQYEIQKDKVEALATETKSRWSIIKKVFL